MTTYPEHTQVKGNLAPTYEVLSSSVIEDKTEFTFNQAGMAHIMSTLTSLYSDPDKAVLREYVSNGIDSHVVAGTTRPVEITLPSVYEPTLVVQDFGTGMSADEMRSIYTSYGLSTKQEDMGQIGNFGYGSKSALAITDQFSVVAVKDGVRTVAIISREESGIPAMNILSSGERVSESNGVTIKIPVKSVYNMQRAAGDYLYTVPRDKAVALGSQIGNIEDDIFDRFEDLNIVLVRNGERNSYSASRFKVVMGGVAYPVSTLPGLSSQADALYSHIRYSDTDVYAEIPIASVDLTPSRENIQWSDRSNKFLAALFNQFADALQKKFKQQIAAADTREEVRQVVIHSLFSATNTFPLHWKSETVLRTHKIGGTTYSADPKGRNTYVVPSERVDPFTSGGIPEILVTLDGADAEAFLRNPRKNLLDYASDKILDFRVRFYVLTPSEISALSEWVSDTGFFTDRINVSDVLAGARQYRSDRRKENAQNRGPAQPRTAVTYPVYTLSRDKAGALSLNRESLSADKIPADALVQSHADVKVVPENVWLYPYNPSNADELKALALLGLVDRPIVLVEKGRKVEALNKRVKRTMDTLVDFVEKAFTELYENIPEGTMRTVHTSPIYANQNIFRLVNDLREVHDTVKIQDQEIVDLIKDLDTDLVPYAQTLAPLRLGTFRSDAVGYRTTLPQSIDPVEYGLNEENSLATKYGEIIQKYPLVDNYSSKVYDGTHIALYINSVYNHLNRKDS